jgi:multiple sugar transport system permease protein
VVFEAAKIDGASHRQILFRVMIPYSKMGIASLVILSFIDNWNMVEQPIVFLKASYQYPLSVFLSSINVGQLDLAFVCGVLAIAPTVLLYLFLKDALIEGIENSSLK